MRYCDALAADDVAADAAEPVDPDFDGHHSSKWRGPCPSPGSLRSASPSWPAPLRSRLTSRNHRFYMNGLRGGQSRSRVRLGHVHDLQHRDRGLFRVAVVRYLSTRALRYRKYPSNLPQLGGLGISPLFSISDGDESIWIHAVRGRGACRAHAAAALRGASAAAHLPVDHHRPGTTWRVPTSTTSTRVLLPPRSAADRPPDDAW